jgi:hypothetical protein
LCVIFIAENIIRKDISHEDGLSNPELQDLIKDLPAVLVQARAPTTNKIYGAAFEKWKNWAGRYDEVSYLPANPLHIVAYCLFLARNSSSFNVINTTICSLAWAHKVAGLDSPTENVLVTEALNGLKRQFAKPIVPKEPFSF